MAFSSGSASLSTETEKMIEGLCAGLGGGKKEHVLDLTLLVLELVWGKYLLSAVTLIEYLLRWVKEIKLPM